MYTSTELTNGFLDLIWLHVHRYVLCAAFELSLYFKKYNYVEQYFMYM